MSRLRTVSFFFLVLFLPIWLRLFYWQILQNEALAADAQSQYASEYNIFPKRGRILAADGFPLVTNEAAYLVYAEPKKLAQTKKNYLAKLAALLEIKQASIAAKLVTAKSWVPLAHNISQQVRKQIEALNITGIGFETESRRFYPESSSSAHLLGFVGRDLGGEPTGYFGLEGYYDEILRGKPGFVHREKDALGLPIPIGIQRRVDPVNGADLLLYLDRGMQQIVAKQLKKGIERYGAKSGGVIVMQPATGAIMATAWLPGYDPANYTQFAASLYKNPLIAATYEPGSTFKVLVLAAAINERVVEPTTIYDENGPVTVQGYTIRTWNNRYHGKLTMTQILEHSSNVGMVFVADKLGIDKFYDYLKKYGLGGKTGIDLQEEVAPHLRPREKWKKIDLATASFGQGIAVTPIQLIRAVAAIANGGRLVRPQVAAAIQSDETRKIDFNRSPAKRILSPATAAVMAEMMVAAVENGEAKWAIPAGFRIAGKTGTAQVPIAGHYDPQKTIASFIGFAPVEKPEFIMLVILREPTSSPWGSETAAPLFFTIARDLFAYLGISPG